MSSNLSLAIRVRVHAGNKIYEADADRAESAVYDALIQQGVSAEEFRAVYKAYIAECDGAAGEASARWQSWEKIAHDAAVQGWAKPGEAIVELYAQ